MIYLTEQLLGKYLKLAFPNTTIIHDKPLTKHGLRTRPDYLIEELNLIVEFDGDRHFNSASVILFDEEKTKRYKNLGYDVVRIPYFVQLDDVMVSYYFSKYNPIKVDLKNDVYDGEIYPHGFIDKKAMLPAEYCTLGICMFMEILNCVPLSIASAIRKSIHAKLKIAKNPYEVIPMPIDISSEF